MWTSRTSFKISLPRVWTPSAVSNLKTVDFPEKLRWFFTCGRAFCRLLPELTPKLKHHHVLGLTLWNISMTWFKQNDINRWAVPVAFSSQFTRLHRRWNRLSEKKWNFPFPCHRFKYKRHIFAEPTNIRPCFH